MWMMILTDFPSIVKKYAPHFEDCFSAAHYEHFKKALSGFMVSDNKTLEGMNRIFLVNARDQSVFNKFFNSENYDLEELSEKRLSLLQGFKQTRFKTDKHSNGVLSVDNSLLKHYGKKIDNIYYLYDYVDKCYRWSHDLVTLYYSDRQTDYPVYHQLWIPAEWDAVAQFFMEKGFTINEQHWQKRHDQPQKWRNYIRSRYKTGKNKFADVKNVYKGKLDIAEDLIRKFCHTYPDLYFPIALDSGFTSAPLCKVIEEELKRDYIGALREDQKVLAKLKDQKDSQEIALKKFIAELRTRHADIEDDFSFEQTTYFFRGQEQIAYTYCGIHRISGFRKKQKLLISFKKEDASDRPRFSIVNRLDWHPKTILRNRRHRWPVETFHQEGKSEGLEKYQVRNDRAVQVYITLVTITFCMLKCATQDDALQDEIQQRLQMETDGTLPFLRRLMKAEGLLGLVEYVFMKVHKGHSLSEVFQPIAEHIAYQ